MNEPAHRTVGGKVVHIERIEWAVIPDTSTVSNALTTGEIDWWGTPVSDLLPSLKKQKGIVFPVILVPSGHDRDHAVHPVASAVQQSGDPARDRARGRAG